MPGTGQSSEPICAATDAVRIVPFPSMKFSPPAAQRESSVRQDKMSDRDLLLLREDLRAEMRKRGIADSVGAIEEQLAIKHFRKTPGLPKLQLAMRGRKNVDALSRNGDPFAIKTVCEDSKTETNYPDPDA